MGIWLKVAVTCQLALTALMTRERDERGDVPGWVMITVMSSLLVGIIYGVAKDEVGNMVRSALRSVG